MSKVILQWQKDAKLARKPLLIAALVLCLGLLFDFMQRVWVPGQDDAVATLTVSTKPIQFTKTDIYTKQMNQWQEEIQAGASVVESADETPVADIPLPGGFTLANLRVRVRAVFVKQQPELMLALVELQNLADGKLSLQRINPGSELDGYKVESIDNGAVMFSDLNDSTRQLLVPVFKGENE